MMQKRASWEWLSALLMSNWIRIEHYTLALAIKSVTIVKHLLSAGHLHMSQDGEVEDKPKGKI